MVHDRKYTIKRHTNAYINSSHSLVSTSKPKAKYGLHEPTYCFTFNRKKRRTVTEDIHQRDKCTGSHIAPTSPVRMVATLFLLMEGK